MQRFWHWLWKRCPRFVRGSNVGGCSGVGGGRGIYSLQWRRSKQRVVGGSVCFGGAGGSGGDNIYEFVFVVLLQDRVFMVEFQCRR